MELVTFDIPPSAPNRPPPTADSCCDFTLPVFSVLLVICLNCTSQQRCTDTVFIKVARLRFDDDRTMNLLCAVLDRVEGGKEPKTWCSISFADRAPTNAQYSGNRNMPK